MPDTFNFKKSRELLQINPRSFLEWLMKAGIDASTQVNLADPREKYLTKEQLVRLAQLHGRTLPALDDEEPNEHISPPMTLETLAEQLANAQQQNAARFEQIEQLLHQLLATQHYDHFQQTLTSIETLLQQHSGQLTNDTTPTDHTMHTAESTAIRKPERKETGATPSPRTKSKSKTMRKKRSVRGRKLPAGLMLLRDFASQHGIATDRASAAGKSGKMNIVRGKWLVNSRWATEALEAQGQHDFYTIFHEREGFQICDQCPHNLL
jgi:hypothetical protein